MCFKNWEVKNIEAGRVGKIKTKATKRLAKF